MSDFVEQCRQEWRRLGVPHSLAEEMAADLATDLQEAEAEGVSPEELLGSSAFDPRAFAASWAAERGIIPTPSSPATTRGRPLVLVAFTAVAAIAAIFAALALLTGRPKLSIDAVGPRGAHLPSTLPGGPSVPRGSGRVVLLHGNASAPVEWILLCLAIVALGFAAWLWSSRNRQHPRGVPVSH